MTSIQNILGTVAGSLGNIFDIGLGSLANITETISGISTGTSPDAPA